MIKCFINSISLFGPNRFSVHPSYLFSLACTNFSLFLHIWQYIFISERKWRGIIFDVLTIQTNNLYWHNNVFMTVFHQLWTYKFRQNFSIDIKKKIFYFHKKRHFAATLKENKKIIARKIRKSDLIVRTVHYYCIKLYHNWCFRKSRWI